MEDYAVVATFWFRRGQIFIEAAQEMIKENDRINNEFYVDKTMEYVLRAGGRVKILEVDRASAAISSSRVFTPLSSSAFWNLGMFSSGSTMPVSKAFAYSSTVLVSAAISDSTGALSKVKPL